MMPYILMSEMMKGNNDNFANSGINSMLSYY